SPAASSSTLFAPKLHASRNGLIAGTIRRTRRSRPRNTASIGNRMKNVWIEPVREIRRPSPGSSPSRPSSPRVRAGRLSARSTRPKPALPVSSTRDSVSMPGSDKGGMVEGDDRDGGAERQVRAVGERRVQRRAAESDQQDRDDAGGDDPEHERTDRRAAEQE